MSGEGLSSPLIRRYQETLEQNPRSRVFAPLAESFRKLGMIDKAVEVLKSGIRYNPNYVLGYLGMAFCYVDMKKHSLAYATLRPIVETNRDNIRLQKLFATVCQEVGHFDEALETYKYLLFVNPRDEEIAKLVRELEKKSGGEPAVVTPTKVSEHISQDKIFDADKIDSKAISDADDWVAVNFAEEKPVLEEIVEKAPEEEVFEVEHQNIDEQEVPSSQEIPVVTHTLVDIYCAQGYLGKAKEVLEKILELNPDDEKTSQKLNEINDKLCAGAGDEGRSHLMEIIDEKFGANENDQHYETVKKKFDAFQEKLKKRASKTN